MKIWMAIGMIGFAASSLSFASDKETADSKVGSIYKLENASIVSVENKWIPEDCSGVEGCRPYTVVTLGFGLKGCGDSLVPVTYWAQQNPATGEAVFHLGAYGVKGPQRFCMTQEVALAKVQIQAILTAEQVSVAFDLPVATRQ